MSNVIDFTGTTVGPVDPEKVLDGARGLKSVLILGWDDKDEFYIASSDPNIGELLILLELGKRDTLGWITETD